MCNIRFLSVAPVRRMTHRLFMTNDMTRTAWSGVHAAAVVATACALLLGCAAEPPKPAPAPAPAPPPPVVVEAPKPAPPPEPVLTPAQAKAIAFHVQEDCARRRSADIDCQQGRYHSVTHPLASARLAG